ncbi:MAG: hypothetical protein J0L66_02610 [Cytophagales bacterium]|nr:hypothetical protein [Cytophagales bacterium]
MEKERFNQLVHNYTALTEAEASELYKLQADYPYSQVLHVMAARAAQDNNLPNRDHQLHLTAIYSTDRQVLKSIMTALQQPRGATMVKVETPAPANVTLVSAEVKPVAASESKLPQSGSTLTGDALYEEVMHDLEELKERKARFEKMVSDLEKGHPLTENPKTKKRTTDPDEGLLNEIKSQKKKIKPDGPKQKEQIEIIDQFIKAQPALPKPKAGTEIKTDLAESSSAFGENVVSETLVEILLKQGKTDKAIEVLKKLIWKFPQKKAYFAAQIEELKK